LKNIFLIRCIVNKVILSNLFFYYKLNNISMENTKKIMFDQNLAMPNKNKTRRREKKSKPKPNVSLQPTKLKKTLLDKIKKHQQEQKEQKEQKEKSSNKKEIEEFQNSFTESLNYLNNLKKNMNKKKYKSSKSKKNKGGYNEKNTNIQSNNDVINVNTAIKGIVDSLNNSNTSSIPNANVISNNINQHIIKPSTNVATNVVNTVTENVNLNIPLELANNAIKIPRFNIKPPPPYGCLKNSSVPTYRQYYNKTLKKKSKLTHGGSNNKVKTNVINKHINKDIISKTSSDRENKLKLTKGKYKKIKKKIKKYKKTKYTLGKKGKTLSVLIKNNKTRRKIKQEQGLLKQTPINVIKKTLYEKNLIKFGSSAPNDILRAIYENSILAGEVSNTNMNNVLDNYMKKE
jgi:hypothetical protein